MSDHMAGNGREGPRETVLITGSNGFLGQAITRRLLKTYRVIGLDIHPSAAPLEGMSTLAVDLTKDVSVQEAVVQARKISGGPIASVIHLAAYYDITGHDDPRYQSVTVEGARRLLAALQGGPVGQFVFASTMLVHAPAEPGEKIREDQDFAPAWAYPRSKADAEAAIREERGAIPVVMMRPAGVYNEDCRAAFLAQQMARIYERLPTAYLFTGDIDRGQPYLHLDDLTDAVARIVERRERLAPVDAFLLGEETTPTYREMQQRLGRLIHGETWRTFSIPKPLGEMGVWFQTEVLDEDAYIKPWMARMSEDHYELDIRHAREALGWSPRHDLLRTMPEMVRRLKADPTGFYERNKLDAAAVAAAPPELEEAVEDLENKLTLARLRKADDALDSERRSARWTHLVNMALGLWLIASPFTYGLFGTPAEAVFQPALGHDLPSADLRNVWLGWSEIFSGLAIILFSAFAMTRRGFRAAWGAAAVGVWLLHAPLVFWTTNAAAYASDTLIGVLVIALAVIVGPQPGISREARATGGDRPLGWSYSPSSFTQRAPIVALAFVGFFISRYLAAYQLGHIDGVWDPFFGPAPGVEGSGSETVVSSAVSRAFPIADAGFGAIIYMLDILTGSAGGRRRWRTMPWMVLLFGMLIVSMSVVSVTFIIIQPTIIGTLCALCLLQAAVTVIMVPYSVDEVLASIQYLVRSKRAGRPFWRTLAFGGPALLDERDTDKGMDQPATALLCEFITAGVNYPWTLAGSILLGVALLASPLWLGADGPIYFSHHVAGCLAITVGVMAMAEITRAIRFLNAAIGAWIVVSPFVLGADALNTVAAVILGLVLIGLSLPRGKRGEETYGGWDRLIV